jgi:hypothetical protein
VPKKTASTLYIADDRWSLLYVKKLEGETVRAFQYLRSHGVEAILIKGWAAARKYPPDRARFYSDVDLAVSELDFELAEDLKNTEVGQQLSIDLHRELRHLDSRPWSEIFNDSHIVDLNGCDLRIPCEEDHLRIISTHWLTDGGENQEKLWDIYFAVENRSEGFSWEKCLGSVSANRQTWVICAIGAAHRYLDLTIDDLPFADDAKRLPKWFSDTLEKEWQSGMRIKPLTSLVRSPRDFIQQVRKRLPPNPIRATIENGGNMFEGSRFVHQLAVMRRRARPSINKVLHRLLRGRK